MEHIYDVIIIGGGPGGYTAALYTARAGLDTLVFEKLSVGGQMVQTMQIDNYPGFDEGIDGFTLGVKMRSGAEKFGAETKMTEVLRVKLTDDIKMVETDIGIFYARSVIIATGADHRHLGIAKEEMLVGRGISYCASCDGMFYRGKVVAVVGGGNSAASAALQLSRICRKVIFIHRKDTLRATKVYHEPILKAENVEFHWNNVITEFVGEDKLDGLRLKDVNTGDETEVMCDGLFVSIGRDPVTGLFKNQLELDEQGYIKADESTKTNIPGVFAVGDVRKKALRQIVTAAADGATASYYVEEYLTLKR